jgi:hypothetical protein
MRELVPRTLAAAIGRVHPHSKQWQQATQPIVELQDAIWWSALHISVTVLTNSRASRCTA